MVIVKTILIFILVLSILDMGKEGFMFYKAYVTSKNNMTDKRLLFLGLSVSAFVSIIYALICL